MSGKKKKKEDKGFEIIDKPGAETAEPSEEEQAGSQAVEDTPVTEAAEEKPAAQAAEETPTAEAPADEPSVQAAEEPPGEQAAEAPPKEEERAPDVYTVALWAIGLLASAGWQSMGLQINPATGKAEKDLQHASVAIDCVTALSDRISRHLDESQRRELRGLVSDLQINFVNQSREPSG